MIEKDDAVQFTEKHKWCGCLGVVTEDKGLDHPRRYMISTPIPERGVACIYDDGSGIEPIDGTEVRLKDLFKTEDCPYSGGKGEQNDDI